MLSCFDAKFLFGTAGSIKSQSLFPQPDHNHHYLDQVGSILPALKLLPLEPQLKQSRGSNPNAGKIDQNCLI